MKNISRFFIFFLVFSVFLIGICEAEELPDLIVSDIGWMRSDPPDGGRVRIVATIKNIGTGDTYRDFWVYFYVDERYMEDNIIEGLQAGETKETSIGWTVRPGTHNVYVKVDGKMYGSHSDIPESNEDNNDLEISFDPKSRDVTSTKKTASPYIILSSTCSDETPCEECSVIKPGYCKNGILIDKCSLCGCPPDQECQPDGSCKASVEETFGIFTAFVIAFVVAALFSFVSDRKIKTTGMKRWLLIVTIFTAVSFIVFMAFMYL